jgi:hypothetical protein
LEGWHNLVNQPQARESLRETMEFSHGVVGASNNEGKQHHRAKRRAAAIAQQERVHLEGRRGRKEVVPNKQKQLSYWV